MTDITHAGFKRLPGFKITHDRQLPLAIVTVDLRRSQSSFDRGDVTELHLTQLKGRDHQLRNRLGITAISLQDAHAHLILFIALFVFGNPLFTADQRP